MENEITALRSENVRLMEEARNVGARLSAIFANNIPRNRLHLRRPLLQPLALTRSRLSQLTAELHRFPRHPLVLVAEPHLSLLFLGLNLRSKNYGRRPRIPFRRLS